MSEKNNQDTRKAIIEASMRLFAQRGYHGTSVAQIAEATNLTKGALYWYFKGKEDLFITVLERIRDNWQEKIMSRVESSHGAAERLEHLFDATSEMVAATENPYSMHLFLVSAGAQQELGEFEKAIKSAYRGYVKTLADTLRAGQEDGEIRRDIDAESAAIGIIGCLEGIVLQARLYPPATIASAIAETKNHFVRSLAASSTTPLKKEKREKPAASSADQMNLL